MKALGPIVRKWQRRLGLTMWEVSAKLVPVAEDKELAEHDAYILIIEDLTAEMVIDQAVEDIEECIIHEMFHLFLAEHFGSLWATLSDLELKDYCEERAVNKLTRSTRRR